jgi:DNA-binding transcriptional LysR family regulator
MEDLRRLRTFAEVAQRGSFSAAAEALAFTQPSVSRQIASLETEVGAKLLERDARQVRLTQEGELFLGHVEAVLGRIDVAQAELQALGELDGGCLRMCAFSSANASLVPRAFGLFTARYPKVQLLLAQERPGEEIAHLRAGELDLALLTSEDVDPEDPPEGVELIRVLEDELYLAIPRGHRLEGRKRLSLGDLEGEIWIEGSHPDCLGMLEELSHAIGHEPNIGFYCDDWTGKQALVGAGMGVMLLSSLAAETVRSDIVVMRLPRALPPRVIYAVVPDGYRAPAADEMIACLKQVAESLPALPPSG